MSVFLNVSKLDDVNKKVSVLTCLFSVMQEAWKTGEKSLLLHSKQFDQLISWLVNFLHSGKEEKKK